MFETAPSSSASCLLAPHGREDAVKLRLLEGEEAEDFRDMLENLSDYNKVCNYPNGIFHPSHDYLPNINMLVQRNHQETTLTSTQSLCRLTAR